MAKTSGKSGGAPFKKILATLLLLVLAGGVLLYLNLGSVVKSTAEKIGSKTLGVSVKIATVDIDIKNMAVEVRDIRLGNPSGFKGKEAMSIGFVKIDVESFAKELLRFSEITVADTDIYLEVNQGGTNLGAINKQVKSSKKADTAAKEPIKVIIDRFLLGNATLHTSTSLIAQDIAPVTIPDIRLSGIGQKENGVLAHEAIAQIWDAVSTKAIKAAGSAGALQGLSTQALEDLQANFALPTGFASGNAIEENIGKAKDKLKGLLGR